MTQGSRNEFTYELKPGSVQVSGATAEAAVQKSLAAQGAPNATVKVKVGGGSPAEDADRVAAVRAALGPGRRIRLDANGAWDVDTAVAAGNFRVAASGADVGRRILGHGERQREPVVAPPLARRRRAIVEHVETIWQGPDDGIWESRGPRRQVGRRR